MNDPLTYMATVRAITFAIEQGNRLNEFTSGEDRLYIDAKDFTDEEKAAHKLLVDHYPQDTQVVAFCKDDRTNLGIYVNKTMITLFKPGKSPFLRRPLINSIFNPKSHEVFGVTTTFGDQFS